MPTQTVLHQPRLAWDAARTIVAAAASHDHSTWAADLLGTLLGPQFRQAALTTRVRLLWPDREDAVQVEAGVWRVRLEDALRTRPDVALRLKAMVADIAARLSGA